MQHTEKKALYDYGIHTWVFLLCLMASAVAVAEKVSPSPMLSQPAANPGQGAVIPVAGEAAVSINQAGAEQLASILKGIGLKKAESIVRYREQNGPFTQIEQLQEVPGIGPELFEKNRSRLKI
ncbi:ComEA family DNA-binding protein [Serratia symbiotica]|uniref:ComEA family DNA-binding protein n=1 Tax=Serratia symbiotica TaxID=138074 RepID=UPI001329C652|nr:ComEA family DNA-binding protein [Serratia symbiotica]MBF1994855.1 ComEA family DNA-binding protein [Serratia symbiotica]MBQ0954489.1 ComEA family DNA-binding protein [Serratia symbiotica]QTP13937.1 ComEA family DNA-binding protein [Serratia symbiotica]